MGIEPFLVASSLVGLLAQRLVRRAVHGVRAPGTSPPDEELRELGLDAATFCAGGYQRPERQGHAAAAAGHGVRAGRLPGAACELGYKGRTGIYELLMIDEKVRRLALEKADAGSIRNAGRRRAAWCTLRDDGARKVRAGMTTPEEVMLMTAESTD